MHGIARVLFGQARVGGDYQGIPAGVDTEPASPPVGDASHDRLDRLGVRSGARRDVQDVAQGRRIDIKCLGPC